MKNKMGFKVKKAVKKYSPSPGIAKRASLQKKDSPVNHISHLQRMMGNQAVQRLLKSGTLQAKLEIGKPNDKYEKEADKVADIVMRMPEPYCPICREKESIRRQPEEEEEEEEAEKAVQTKPIAEQITPLVQRQEEGEEEEEEEPIQTKPITEHIMRMPDSTCPSCEEDELVQRQEEEPEEEEEEEAVQAKPVAEQITPLIQRQEEEPEEEEEEVQTKQITEEVTPVVQRQEEEEEEVQAKENSSSTAAVTSNVEPGINSLKGGGQPLSKSVRNYFEPRFGVSLNQVRIHTNSQAANIAKSINAKAFTTGRDVVFGNSEYSPETVAGKRLLAHELTHVVQQSTTAGLSKLQRLGANPGCSATQRRTVHQAIYNSRGWLNKAITALGAAPLSARALRALRRNFGSTYGVAANAPMIRNRLIAARAALGRNPFTCDPGTAAWCAANRCGFSVYGSNASTICANVTLTPGRAWQFQAGCVLHETFHARFSRMTYDSYSGWHGFSRSSPGYPGANPLLNPDSYTTLAMDLS